MARIELDPNAYRSITQSPEAYAVLALKANQIKERAEATAPEQTGEYASKFRVHGGRQQQGSPVIYVANDDDAAAHIEWGTKHTPAHKTMSSALESVIE
ncbi:hypothetical protein [Kutzneria chonburiensis]|uniref:HK97 gp10 family phage protein n=1 Tax=Kutzneria chonburiensis TaxID=1483604 RepID=A0ABV6N3C0_9PSEU|nr:hypothetical protein [Kutzneria chonburiensis]